MIKLKLILSSYLRPQGKYAFISKLKQGQKLLDVGCGNNSPYLIKLINSEIVYTGIDIGDNNQNDPESTDYVITTAESFRQTISNYVNIFDAVISSHNLEHCYDPNGVLIAMLNSLKKGGQIFLSFPCSNSIHFPSRNGTLNYFDDNTHQCSTPDFDMIVEILRSNNFKINYMTKNYQPIFLYFIGLLINPISKFKRKVMIGTWEYFGFESIIWATKSVLKNSQPSDS